MIISHNLLAINANRQFNITTKNKAKSTEKLSSGYRINRAADDAEGKRLRYETYAKRFLERFLEAA